jgi:hypothetical protein
MRLSLSLGIGREYLLSAIKTALADVMDQHSIAAVRAIDERRSRKLHVDSVAPPCARF